MDDFESVQPALTTVPVETIYWVIGGLVALLLVAILLIIWRKATAGRREQAAADRMLMFTSFERMRDQGLISEEEYRRIKQKAAERELEEMRRAEKERDAKILEEAAINPDAVRKLLADREAARATAATAAPRAQVAP